MNYCPSCNTERKLLLCEGYFECQECYSLFDMNEQPLNIMEERGHKMDYIDETKICKDCGNEFTILAGEQAFFAEKGLQQPIRCKDCRAKRRADSSVERPAIERFEAVCAACGVITSVPFKPTEGRPVYCRDCFKPSK